MEEYRHQVAFGLGLLRLLPMPILRMVSASFDSVRSTRTMVATDGHAEGGWVPAPVTARLALRRATRGLA
jgi:hypothetical protein